MSRLERIREAAYKCALAQICCNLEDVLEDRTALEAFDELEVLLGSEEIEVWEPFMDMFYGDIRSIVADNAEFIYLNFKEL